MRSLVLYLPAATILVVPGLALAELEPRTLYDSRTGEVVKAVYDSAQNITWLADAQAAKGTEFDDGPDLERNPVQGNDGLLSFENANEWAKSLDISGYRNWRLPRTTQPDGSCQIINNEEGGGLCCTGSEMGHLFYIDLDGTPNRSILQSTHPDLALFMNLEGAEWWSSTGSSYYPTDAWTFQFSKGFQTRAHVERDYRFAWAVHDGDVGARRRPRSPNNFE